MSPQKCLQSLLNVYVPEQSFVLGIEEGAAFSFKAMRSVTKLPLEI